ncbi:hypothetical protein [Pseudomonas amygdali]|nr:hypothetical protein [Pseudomonas amygdali]
MAAPFGLDDLFNLVVRPIARFEVEKKRSILTVSDQKLGRYLT